MGPSSELYCGTKQKVFPSNAAAMLSRHVYSYWEWTGTGAATAPAESVAAISVSVS